MAKKLIGEEISTLRKKVLMTVTQLAAKCVVSVTYISMVERGVCNPTDIMKNRIFNAFVV